MIEHVVDKTKITEEILQELLRFLKENNKLRKLKVDMYTTFCRKNNMENINTFDIRKYAFEYKMYVGAFLAHAKSSVYDFNQYLIWRNIPKVNNLLKQFENKFLYDKNGKEIFYFSKVFDYVDNKYISNNSFKVSYNYIRLANDSKRMKHGKDTIYIRGIKDYICGSTIEYILTNYKIINEENVKDIVKTWEDEIITKVKSETNISLEMLTKPYTEEELDKIKYITLNNSNYYIDGYYDLKNAYYSTTTVYKD